MSDEPEVVETAADTPAPEVAAEPVVETPEAPAPTWPEDWRERFGGKDEAAKKVLARYTTPENVAKAYLSLRTQLNSGEYKRHSLPEGAKEEDVAAYRKAWGVPESPEGYIGDRKFSDDDKAALGSFVAAAHAKNLSADAVGVAFDWYQSFMDNARSTQAEFDKAKSAEAEDELRAEWGNEYRSVNNAVTNLVKAAGIDGLLDARMADGTRLADSVPIRKWLSEVVDAMNPALRITGGNDGLKTIQSELETLRAEMRDANSDYHRNPKKRERFYELVALEEKFSTKAA